MKTFTLVFGLVVSLAVVGFGQRTITNSTLEKYKQQRLAAEADYRANYARMGFPSPEELDRQREADMTARLQLADQLRQARLEEERLQLQRRSLDLETIRLDNEIEANNEAGYYGDGYFGGYGFGRFGGFGGFDDFRSGRHHNRFGQRGHRFPRNLLMPQSRRRGGYRVTPFEVIPVPRSQSGRAFGAGRRR